ncbi:MAG: hypothetical protein OEM38_08415 [Gammaproteobacteria bacterium]|nr:hypothetical protein [Gammaproteobacteria bacterium]
MLSTNENYHFIELVSFSNASINYLAYAKVKAFLFETGGLVSGIAMPTGFQSDSVKFDKLLCTLHNSIN